MRTTFEQSTGRILCSCVVQAKHHSPRPSWSWSLPLQGTSAIQLSQFGYVISRTKFYGWKADEKVGRVREETWTTVTLCLLAPFLIVPLIVRVDLHCGSRVLGVYQDRNHEGTLSITHGLFVIQLSEPASDKKQAASVLWSDSWISELEMESLMQAYHENESAQIPLVECWNIIALSDGGTSKALVRSPNDKSMLATARQGVNSEEVFTKASSGNTLSLWTGNSKEGRRRWRRRNILRV